MNRRAADGRPLLQVVADYERLSAVQPAGRAGGGRASRPQYPGLKHQPGPRRRCILPPPLALAASESR
jgi:hypothetical protein